jgi:5'-deoxy-5'-methylthioadenosine phosphorylase
VKLAIIGGSLLKELKDFSVLSEERVKTPFGEPSDNLITGTIDGIEVVYLNRHGVSHHIAPHLVNYKANMFALKVLDVSHVLAVTAVGGISQRMPPMKWVVPDQLIDYTHSRFQTYNDGNGNEVHHIDFTYPFDEILRSSIIRALEMAGCRFESYGTYGVTQGPRLETAAEIIRMKRDGCDIVGMTAMPEASLARELEMSYAQMSLVVNWAAGVGQDAGKTEGMQPHHEVISMDEIRGYITEGNVLAEKLIRNLLTQLTYD